MLKTSYFFLNIMHKVTVQKIGGLFVKNVLVIYFYMVIIKTPKVKIFFTNFWKDWNKFI